MLLPLVSIIPGDLLIASSNYCNAGSSAWEGMEVIDFQISGLLFAGLCFGENLYKVSV